MKFALTLAFNIICLGISSGYRTSWSSWSSWSSKPSKNFKFNTKNLNLKNSLQKSMQQKLNEMMKNQKLRMQSDQAQQSTNVKCHTSCTNGNCETKCTKNGQQVSPNEANFQFNYVKAPKPKPQKVNHSRKRVQKMPVSTSYSSCSAVCKSGQGCEKVCSGPNANNIKIDIKRTGNMKQNVHFDFKVKHQQKNPIGNVGNGHGCVYPRVIVGNSCRMPSALNSRKNMCMKVTTNGRSKSMSVTGMITKEECCCGNGGDTKFGANKCPRPGSNAEKKLCDSKNSAPAYSANEKKVTTESGVTCPPGTPGYNAGAMEPDCDSCDDCGTENTTAESENTSQSDITTEVPNFAEEHKETTPSCRECGSCSSEELRNPTTPSCSNCNECMTTAANMETPEPAMENRAPTRESNCGSCDSSCGPEQYNNPTTPACAGCGGDCATPTPIMAAPEEEETSEPNGCDGDCGDCNPEFGNSPTTSSGGCPTNAPTMTNKTPEQTSEPSNFAPTDAPTTQEQIQKTTQLSYTSDDELSVDYSGAGGDNSQVLPNPMVQNQCNPRDTDCELPTADYNGGVDQNACSGENCGEPVAVDQDCLDCGENDDLPGGDKDASQLMNGMCNGRGDCDLPDTTNAALSTGIPGLNTDRFSDSTDGQYAMIATESYMFAGVTSGPLRRIDNNEYQQMIADKREVPLQGTESATTEGVKNDSYEMFELPNNEEGVCEQSNSFGEVFITSSSSVTREECCCAAYLNNHGNLDANEAASVNRAFNTKACPLPRTSAYRKLCPAKMGVAKYSYKNQPRKLRDINECDLFEACGVNGICQNFKKSYSCDCFKNYKFNPVSMKCEQTVQVKSCFVGRIDDNRQRIKVDNFLMPGFEHVSSRNMNTCGRNLGRHSKKDCCCGAAFDDLFNAPGSVDPKKGGNGVFSWGSNCKACPKRGSSAYRRLCY